MRQFGGFVGHSVRRFTRDRGGNFAVMFGAVAAVLAIGVGFGVDTMQIFNARTALRNALDAAVTSTAQGLTTGIIEKKDANASVMAFITANSTGGMLSHDRIVLDDLQVDPLARTVTATAHVDVELFFPLFGMEKSRRVSDTNAATYSDKKIEVAMMLDLTGSMKRDYWRHTDKIGDLQDAATIAVEAFLGLNNPKSPRVRVALVPYADGVNTGPLANTVFREAKNSSGKADAPPPLTAARPVSAGGSTCANERKDRTGMAMDMSDAGPGTAMVNQDDRLRNSCPDSALVPLTTDQDKLLEAIDDFKADGFTAGHIGIQWTRYLLSPKWRGTLEAAVPDSGPAEYNDRKAKKIAILMTDGLFNTAFAGVRRGDDLHDQAELSQAAAMTMCQRMKLDKIEVFTVGFMLDDPNARIVMKDCASDDYGDIRHYYLAADGEALKAAFREIAANAEKLILTR